MPAPQVNQLHIGPIPSFSFSGDRSKVAISPNGSQVEIYAKKGPSYALAETLTEVRPSSSELTSSMTSW
jgi:hypothetical protein